MRRLSFIRGYEDHDHRRQAGLTVQDLQARFGFEYPQAIYKWQYGECLPAVDNLLALARLLRVPMEDLPVNIFIYPKVK